MTNPFIINFAFWAGALTGALMMASHQISIWLGFNFPFALIFPIATFIIFGRTALKAALFESALDSEGKEKRWGRPQQKKETEK